MEVGTVAVIGAGIMGRGIAHAAALGGYRTILEDILPSALRRAGDEIRANLDKAVELGKVSANEAKDAMGRIEYAGAVEEAARAADLVIEAVPEEMESKIEIFTILDKMCRPGTILASNTSSLSVTEIASVTYRAPKILGMHFFNPVHKMKLVEIVRALESSAETIETIEAVSKRMGKETVLVRESPGFVTSRVNAMIGNEAFYMLQEGVASARDIDKALKLGLNHPSPLSSGRLSAPPGCVGRYKETHGFPGAWSKLFTWAEVKASMAWLSIVGTRGYGFRATTSRGVRGAWRG